MLLAKSPDAAPMIGATPPQRFNRRKRLNAIFDTTFDTG
jgi:hypothetical protein